MQTSNIYQPLGPQDIRLLHIQPGTITDEIRITLEPVSLFPNRPQYEALSYVWGSPENSKSISLLNEGLEQRVNVTANLETALRHLRYEDRVRVLWVDALCINQEDLAERSQQVSKMDLIYTFASATVVYLCEQDEKVDEAIEMLKMFAKNLHLNEYPIWRSASSNSGRSSDNASHQLPESESDLVDPPLRIEDLDSLRQLLTLPWWQRTWVIQEIALAKTISVVCGKQTLSWEDLFVPAARSIDEHVNSCCVQLLSEPLDPQVGASLQLFRTEINNLQEVRDSQYSSKERMVRKQPLHKLVKAFRKRQATDARDKIYGLLGLESIHPGTLIRPDYTLSVSEVYKSVTFKLMDDMQDLSLFYSAGRIINKINQGGSSELPSWVPDWRLEDDDETKSIYWQGYHAEQVEEYNAAAGLQFEIHCIDNDNLIVNGMTFDIIYSLAPPMRYDIRDPPTTAGPTFRSWEAGISACEVHDKKADGSTSNNSYIGGGSWKDAYWRTLCSDLISHMNRTLQHHLSPEKILEVCFQLFIVYRAFAGLDWTPIGDDRGTFYLTAVDPTDPGSFKQVPFFLRGVQNRRLFVTERGYLGLGPEAMQIGDEVQLLAGGNTPFIMRPGQTAVAGVKVDGYRLIGDAYVHGIMQGEGLSRDGSDSELLGKILIY